LDYGGHSTREFNVKVFEHPKLVRADADLTFPTYTKQPPKHIDDTRRVSASRARSSVSRSNSTSLSRPRSSSPATRRRPKFPCASSRANRARTLPPMAFARARFTI